MLADIRRKLEEKDLKKKIIETEKDKKETERERERERERE